MSGVSVEAEQAGGDGLGSPDTFYLQDEDGEVADGILLRTHTSHGPGTLDFFGQGLAAEVFVGEAFKLGEEVVREVAEFVFHRG